ncbi:unnamed protein product, partial [Mesorhabditis belari]|uniref:Fibronectin type-III domain-containing protein n=1 Tax=Mesorhabditis belari TaxID=2138241 RepID=A0AAF3J1I8_9BILA
MGPTSWGGPLRWSLLLLLAGLISGLVRVKRETGTTSQSLLTVEWEGIQTGDHPDSDVQGFLVEYRAENDLDRWNVHSGIIPYKGPNHQYRVQIPRLPMGISFFVRIKVLGTDGSVLVETPEIRARNEMVSIKCDIDDVSEPRNVEITQASRFSLAFRWDVPECGSIGDYQVEVAGLGNASFDIHRQTVIQPSASITNLLPGIVYAIKVRASDRSRNTGPWSSEILEAQTKGDAISSSDAIHIDYRTDVQIRITWLHYDDERLQHYEVMAVEQDADSRRVERARVSPQQSSHVLSGLKPNTRYLIGVVAFVDHEPKQSYSITAQTAQEGAAVWADKPQVVEEADGVATVHWTVPPVTATPVTRFIVEYRLPSENQWQRGDERAFDGSVGDYSVSLSDLVDVPFYAVRIVAVDESNQAVAVTDELTVGHAAEGACIGRAGVPRNVRVVAVGGEAAKFEWDKPSCDESVAPIDGYEYLIWESSQAAPPDGASYVGASTIVVDTLQPSTKFSFKVRSRSGNGHSAWSSPIETTTAANGPLQDLTEKRVKRQSKHLIRDASNLYKLRLVLAPPNSYLVWTPLPQHQGLVHMFKLAYKEDSSLRWSRVVTRPEDFRCPTGVADPEDYCQRLDNFVFRINYQATVSYNLTTGITAPRGTSITFQLVDLDSPEEEPFHIVAQPIDGFSVELHWKPHFKQTVESYQMSIFDGSGRVRLVPLRSNVDSFVVPLPHQPLSPQSEAALPLIVSLEARLISGYSVVQRFEIKSTAQLVLLPAGHSSSSGDSVQIEQPRIEQQGSRSTVYWTVVGQTANVASFQPEIRTHSEQWKAVGEAVDNDHTKSQRHFRQQLGGLSASLYYVRVRAIDSNGRTVATSPSTSFQVQCQAPLAPENVRLDRVSENLVRISWNAPQEDQTCGGVFYITGVVDGQQVNYRVASTERHFDIQAKPSSINLEIRASNKAGSGTASQQVLLSNARQSSEVGHRLKRSICDPSRDFWCSGFEATHAGRQSGQALVSTPQVSTRGNDLHVTWRSEGEGRGVFGYRVQFRTDQSGWNPYGQIVPYTGDNQEYQQTLTGLQLGHTYYIHIQVLDRNSYVMYTSAESSATSECKAPSHPPSHLAVSAPDVSHVRVAWAHPPQSTWGCADLQFEIQAEEPYGQAPVSVAGGQTTHIFQSRPNEKWAVKIRARNSAGHSAWTPISSVRTPAAGELVIGPNVQYRQGSPILSWQSKEGVDSSTVASYSVEWKNDKDENWRQHSNQIPFSGNQRGYQVDLSGLPKGQTYQCRVVAKGPRGEIAFTSPAVAVHTSQACQKPRRAPSGLQVQPVGPTQIKLTWTPLPESEWNCDRVWYIVKYSTLRNQGFKNLTQGENSVLFESDPYTQWRFEVQAANPAGESEWSRTEAAQTQAAAPGPVADLRIQPLGPDSVQVSWRPPANPNGQITSYEITYQLTNRGMCEEVREAPRTEQSQQPYFVLRNLHPHSKYRIGVAARTTIAGERVSQEVSTDQSTPTAAPNYLRVEDSRQDSASISWQAPACLQTNGDITEYEYEVTPADRRTHVQKTTNNVRGTRAQITNLQPNTRYNAKVRAYTARGAGPWSQEVAFQTTGHSIVQAPPHISVIDAGADNAHILWQSSQSPTDNRVDRYKCKYKPARTQEPPKEAEFPAASPCDPNLLRRQNLPPTPPGSQYQCGRIDNLQPEKSYEFQVSACARRTCSDYTKPATAKISDGPVKVLSVTKTGSTDRSLSVRWEVNPEDIPRVTGFRLYVEPLDRSDRPMTFTVDSRTLNYRIDTLRPSTAYNVSVQACTQRECCVGTSATMSTDAAQLQALSVAPRIIAEEATSITIEWNSNSREASGYIVEYRLESGAWQQHPRRVPANPAQTTYTSTVDGLPTNSVVDLRVRVVSAQNEQTAPSPEVRGRTKCQPPSSPPHGLRLDAPSTNEVRVNWARPARDQWQCDHMNIEISYRVGGGPEKTVVVPGDQTEYKFPAEPNQRWLVKLRATNQVGTSGWSPEQSITTRQGTPGAVRDLRVKALSPNEVHVQWLPPLVQRGTIVGYDISYRLKHRLACPEEEPRDVSRDFVTIYNHKDLDYTLTGLLPYSLYEVKVRARTTDLGPEETKEVSTEQQPPSAPPLNLELTYALERSLSFQWEPVDCSQRHGHITNYEYEIIGQDDWAKLERQIANTSDTKIMIDGLTPFTKYVMRVKAYNSIGGGPNTENLDVMTAKADAPLPPQDLVVAQEGTDFFMVSWLPPYPPYGPHDAYKIRHQLLGTDGWETVEQPLRSPLLQCPAESPRFCYNVTDKEPGQQYRVQVACRIEGGNYGPWSSVVIANTLQVLPDAPRAIHLIEKTDHSLHIRWVPPVDSKGHITQYRVSIVSLDDPNDKKRTFLVDHPTLTYLFEQLQPETNYNISIAAGTKRGFGPEIYTRYATDLFNIPAVIGAPVVTPDGASALDVQWNGVQDTKNRVKGYIIEIRNAETSSWTEIGGQTEHDAVKRTYLKKVTGLDPDTLYFVRIKVVDKQQRVSDASPEGQGRTGCAAPSSPPANVAISSPSNKQVRFSWQAPLKGSWQCSAIRYRIEYTNGTNGRQEMEVPSAAIDHMFDSPPNTKWVVRIRTENEAGQSDWSKELEVTTAEGAPGAVTDLTATPEGPTTAVVSWKQPENPNGVITGYTLIYRLKAIGQCGPRSSNPIEKHVRSEEQTLEGLLPDSTYEVQVIAHTSLAGPTSQTVTFTTEEAEPSGEPLNVRIGSVTATRADAMWQQPECEKRHGKITDYEYELEAVDEWADNNTGSSRSERVTFDKLTPYTEYRFRVRALNSQGAGPYSEWVSFTTQPAAPPPPGDLQEEGTFPHAIEISFLPPSPPHGLLDQYKIRYTPSGESNYKEIRVPAERLVCSDANKRDRLCYRLSDLEPEQEYDIQVAAHTEGGGWSDWSASISAKTHEQNIPVLERELEVVDTKPTSISLKWEGLPVDQAAHVVGYALEYKSEDEKAAWAEYNGVTRHRQRQNEYKVTVKELEPATNYFFRLKVVGKNDKRGAPGPVTKAMTSCGKPEEPPSNVKLTSVNFETLKITWEPPSEESWLCNEIEYVIDFVNTTSKGQLNVDPDSPSELIISTMPGTKWEVRMRTETKEDKPQFSRWSDKVSLTTQSLPGEIFVTVTPKDPTTAQVDWDLADKDQGWNYGVDITYRLKQLGGCTEAATGSHEPITRLNVQEKQLLLTDLHPGSTYEVIVTPRRPPSLHSSIVAPKTVRTFKTESDVPTGAPQNLQSTIRKDSELGFKWDPPECAHQNGNVSQYEFILSGLDEWNEGDRESVTPRLSAVIDQLQPGSLYRMKVRAYTSKGAGPWSEPLDIRTTGSELGPPRELTAVQTMSTQIQLTWLPPYPEKAVVTAYRIRYSPRADDSNPTEVEIRDDQLSCTGYKSPIITSDNLCSTIKNLQPSTTYRIAVQGQSASGNWGEWSSDYFSTTRKDDNETLGGSIKLLFQSHDSLRVQWVPPAVIGNKIEKYDVYISVASVLDENPQMFSTSGRQTDYHFRNLDRVTHYNVTVKGQAGGQNLWFISGVFPTTDFGDGLLSWLPAPTDLHLIEKSDTMLHVDWVPPEIWDPEKKELLTHYRVTIAPVDPRTGVAGTPKNYTVLVPGNAIKFEGLIPETPYNITVQGATNSGYGQILWGTYSTLAPGQHHILRLQNRTPTTLTLEWDPKWGTNHRGYTLSCYTITSVYQSVPQHQTRTFHVDSTATEFTVKGLNASTTYNCTLQPKDHAEGAWGVWSTLPPGWFLVKNLKQCDKTNFAVSISWEPIVDNMASDYQVRYLRLKEHDGVWQEEDERAAKELLCPKDGCGRHCYLVFNLPHKPDEYVFQVRAKVAGQWNYWKSAGRLVISEPPHIKASCCIVPPDYHVDNIGAPGTFMDIDVAPSPTDTNITRYYVVVDERDPPGDTNWTELTDKVTAHRKKLPYYVAASFNLETLPEPRKVRLGDGTVIGGYLNYPLTKGKKYNYEIYTLWNITGAPLVGRLRVMGVWPDASPYLTAGWPWYWLLLLLLLLLLLILLCCCLLWCLQRRYRARKDLYRQTTNGQDKPLLKNDAEWDRNIRTLQDRLDRMQSQMGTAQGDFEKGYVTGYKDANRLGSASAARRHMQDNYADRDTGFHEGYTKGLRDAGMTGMTTSMHNLAQKSSGGYSAGFMQGYKDGNSGVFGDRVTPSLISRLDEQYPGQDDFKQGFVDGFKEGCKNRTVQKSSFEDSRRLQQSLTELTERLTSLEKTKGDEIHSTKIYHVYNQQPEFTGYSSTGAQLAHELDEMNSRSRTSTLRRHYTPGDYLKYASEEERYGSLGRNRRSLSASALARETSETRQETRQERQRYASGTLGSSYITRGAADRQGTDTFARRYNYRSRSDMGSPRRYASQTLLDASRPGPSTPHARRDALATLQKELDTLSRSPQGGYASDSAAGYDSVRSKARGYSNYDYDTFQSSQQQQSTSSTTQQQQTEAGGQTATSAVRYPTTTQPTVVSTVTHQIQSTPGTNEDAGRWTDDLIGIVNEPMERTLDRMRQFSTSAANVEGAQSSQAQQGQEVVEEKYHRSYKEEHSTGGR